LFLILARGLTNIVALPALFFCDPDMPLGARKVICSHPAFADRCIFVRRNGELVAFSLAATKSQTP
jgi:hypothetical protein